MKNVIRLILMVALIILASKVLTSDFEFMTTHTGSKNIVAYP
ncbi:hypothetical protein [Formosa sp. A9]